MESLKGSLSQIRDAGSVIYVRRVQKECKIAHSSFEIILWYHGEIIFWVHWFNDIKLKLTLLVYFRFLMWLLVHCRLLICFHQTPALEHTTHQFPDVTAPANVLGAGELNTSVSMTDGKPCADSVGTVADIRRSWFSVTKVPFRDFPTRHACDPALRSVGCKASCRYQGRVGD